MLAGRVDGARLRAIATGRPPSDPPVPVVDPLDLADGADIVVEAAGQQALADHGERYLLAGSRLHLTSGAIGGLDLLRAAAWAGPLDTVTLTTTKQPASLVESWMDDDLVSGLRDGREEIVVFDGPAREAVARFPRSINVAATLALTVGSWDLVRVRLVADPTVEFNRHEIEVTGITGRYRFSVENRPSSDNPRTSAIVANAVLQGLAELCGDRWRLA